ncbi:nicotinate phosphoribosyltransferase [Schaalia meyeri]|uniref:nicotinate phosphoribosyltransferase n=1 Tax=Schaalia meyeri TaxID=52773 RepID=UPI0006817102|nr:nicotinate phosphoribosyltransferase [Schaalia meyeri]AKU64629.1 nicotinate phosphoribosyltransferase [Schaalia meyeri]
MPASLSTSLLTDMYELTMLDAALKDGTAHRSCTFELFGRRLPATRRFGVVAGTGRILEALERFQFDAEQIGWLTDRGIISAKAAAFLASWRFTGDIWGYAEGECYFPGSPLLTVEGSFADCTLLETLLLSILNHDCAVASAASRMTIAAHGRPCMDMGARRAHERAAVSAARAAVIGGFQGTSDLEAAKRYGIRVIGTAAHAFTLLHDCERDAFDSQVTLLGAGTTLLVDTYDIAQGVINAVEAARAAGGELGAVRLDSGDLVAQAFKVRGQLDAMGATSTKITVTSDLDEYAIAALGAAPVDSYGVGTKLVTGSGVPTAALVYKVVQREDASGAIVPVAKKSESKSTVGGRKVAGRVMGEDGYATEELLLVGTSIEEGQALLAERGARPLQVPLVRGGVIDSAAWSGEALARARERHLRARNELPYQGWRLSEGDVAIPTRYEQIA